MTSSVEQVISALEKAGVRYIIVGGVAVVLHGYLRATADLDLVVQLDRENALAAIKAISQLGYRPRAPVAAEAFADPDMRRAWYEEKNMQVFSLWQTAGGVEIDLFVREPFDFDTVHARAVRATLDTGLATVIALEDLLVLKKSAGRPQDLADVHALRSLKDKVD